MTVFTQICAFVHFIGERSLWKKLILFPYTRSGRVEKYVINNLITIVDVGKKKYEGYSVSSLVPPIGKCHNTVRCRYNAVSFLHIPHNRHSIARPLGRGMGCLMWFSCLSHVLLLSVQRCVWNRDKLNRVITALDCISYQWLSTRLR